MLCTLPFNSVEEVKVLKSNKKWKVQMLRNDELKAY